METKYAGTQKTQQLDDDTLKAEVNHAKVTYARKQ